MNFAWRSLTGGLLRHERLLLVVDLVKRSDDLPNIAVAQTLIADLLRRLQSFFERSARTDLIAFAN